MGFAEFVAFVRAFPELVKVMGEVVSTLQQLKQDSIDKQLENYRADVAATLKQIEGAKTNEDRKRLSMELALRMSK